MRGIMVIVFISLLLSGCASQIEPTATPIPTPDNSMPVMKIGMVAGAGGVEDGGFNELTFAGISAVARREGAEFEVVSDVEPDNYVAEIERMASEGFNVVVTVSYTMSEATIEVADRYADVHFVGIDQFQAEVRQNVTGIIFPDDQAGFLAGVLAGNITETNTVAGVYGPESVLPVLAFATGFENGVKSVNANIEVITTFHPGGVEVAFSDLEWGSATAIANMEAGADVIFTAAGDTGRGALVAVANAVEPDIRLYCIGVDTDQWLTVAQARSCLVSSAIKDIPVAIDRVISQILEGNPTQGNYLGPIGLAPFHDFAPMISDELRLELDNISTDLLNGVVSTGYVPPQP